MRVKDLAALLDLPFEGNGELELDGAASLDDAGSSDLSFAGNRKACAQAQISAAGCLIVPPDALTIESRTLIRSPTPRASFASALRSLYPDNPRRAGIHPSAIIEPTASIHGSASIGPNVTIDVGAQIGAHTSVGSGCFIGEGANIGANCVLHPRVVVYEKVSIGDRVTIHAGAVLGADGFGFVFEGDRYAKFPQVGRVVIEDDVEIGANTCIDRAALGVTSIGKGTKLDNLVHIGHNCKIGKHVVIAAQTGLSGGVVVGDNAIIGGQVGVGDKARIESGAVIGSKAGILPAKIVRAGQPQWGIPARPLKDHLRALAYLNRASRTSTP